MFLPFEPSRFNAQPNTCRFIQRLGFHILNPADGNKPGWQKRGHTRWNLFEGRKTTISALGLRPRCFNRSKPDSMQDSIGSKIRKRETAGTRQAGPVTPAELEPARLTPAKILLLAGMAIITFVLTAAIVVLVARLAVTPGNEQDQGPIPLLPREPDGVTIVPKQTDNDAAPLSGVDALPGANPDIADGFAIELGSALSFAELSARFAQLASQNAEAGLDQLEPRATLVETATGLEARLLVGPYDTEEAASQACLSIALPQGIVCKATPFKGELISRE